MTRRIVPYLFSAFWTGVAFLVAEVLLGLQWYWAVLWAVLLQFAFGFASRLIERAREPKTTLVTFAQPGDASAVGTLGAIDYGDLRVRFQREQSLKAGIIICPEEAETFLAGGYTVAEETHEGCAVLVARSSDPVQKP